MPFEVAKKLIDALLDSKENSININELNINNIDKNLISIEEALNEYDKIVVADKFAKLLINGVNVFDSRLTKDKIIYVSCNPATLARDLKYLISKGAKIESVQPFDMFCHTYHVENVAIIDLKEVNK